MDASFFHVASLANSNPSDKPHPIALPKGTVFHPRLEKDRAFKPEIL